MTVDPNDIALELRNLEAIYRLRERFLDPDAEMYPAHRLEIREEDYEDIWDDR